MSKLRELLLKLADELDRHGKDGPAMFFRDRSKEEIISDVHLRDLAMCLPISQYGGFSTEDETLLLEIISRARQLL